MKSSRSPALRRVSRGARLARPLAAVLLATGACTPAVVRLAEPVGPDPRIAPTSGEDGTLVVYTDLADSGTDRVDDVDGWEHMPYRVYDAACRLVADVTNHDFADGGPRAVPLPPGTYEVRAPGLSARGGALRRRATVDAAVRIEAGKTTTLHLDRPWQPPRELAGKDVAARAAPDWRVGWSAHAGAILGTEGELRYVGAAAVAAFVADARASFAEASFTIDPADSPAAVALGSAELAGLVGAEPAPRGARCEVLGYDRLAVVVRDDSPLRTLTAAQVADLESGALARWSALGGPDAPIVLVAGRDTGAEAAVRSPRAVVLGPDEVLRRVSLASDVIGLTSAATVAGARGVRTVAVTPPPGDAANDLVPVSLCAAGGAEKAQAFLRWAEGEQGRSLARRLFVAPTELHGGGGTRPSGAAAR